MRAALSRLARFRAEAESRMGVENGASDARVVRLVEDAVNPVTGFVEPVVEVVHSLLPMRLATMAAHSLGSTRVLTVPGGTVSVATRRADFPFGTPRFRDGDIVEIVAGDHEGTRWTVLEADAADQQTAYRVPVVGVQ